MATIVEELFTIVQSLPPAEQQRVLDYALEINQHLAAPASQLPPAKPISEFLAFRSSLDRETVEEMARAIEEGCENVETDNEDVPF